MENLCPYLRNHIKRGIRMLLLPFQFRSCSGCCCLFLFICTLIDCWHGAELAKILSWQDPFGPRIHLNCRNSCVGPAEGRWNSQNRDSCLPTSARIKSRMTKLPAHGNLAVQSPIKIKIGAGGPLFSRSRLTQISKNSRNLVRAHRSSKYEANPLHEQEPHTRAT